MSTARAGWLAVVALGCAASEEPSPRDTDGTEVVDTDAPTTPPETDIEIPLPTGTTGTTGTTDTAPTTDTAAPTAVPDPFLAGDPATIVGQLTLSWDLSDVPPSDWWVTGYTFEPGRFEWTGSQLVAATGLESCEVRDGDPEISTKPANAGAIVLVSASGQVQTTSDEPGWYSGHAKIGDLDPRGLDWQIVAEGDDLPAFDLLAAITFPTGELAVTQPVDASDHASSDPLAVTWTGDAAERVEVELSGGQIRVRCLADDDGAFEVDAATLAMLPPGVVSFEVTRVALEGHTIGVTDWVEVRAEQIVRGTFDLTP